MFACFIWNDGVFHRDGRLFKNYQSAKNHLNRKGKTGYVRDINQGLVLYYMDRLNHHH